MKNKLELCKKKYIHLPFIITLFTLLLLQSATSLYALAPPVELNLKTVIEPTISFTIDETLVTIVPGVNKQVDYHLRGNILLNVTITSSNPTTTGAKPFKMVHENSGISSTIPYNLRFSYGGSLSNVVPGQTKAFTGFNSTTGYTLDKTMIIVTDANEELPAGTYSDTLTFTVSAQ